MIYDLRFRNNKKNKKVADFLFFALCFSSFIFALCFIHVSNIHADTSQQFNESQTIFGVDTLAPTVPTNLIVTPISSSQIDLAWDASTDLPVGGSGVAGYRVIRDSSFVATTTTTTFSDIFLTASTTYTYTVQAFDNSHNISASSDSAATTTLAEASPSPTPTPTPTVTPTTSPSSGFSSGGSTIVANGVNNPSIYNISVDAGLNRATLSFMTNVSTQARVYWGETPDHEVASLSSLLYGTSHELALIGLKAGTHYFLRVEASDNKGSTIFADVEFITQSVVVNVPMPNPSNFTARSLVNSVYLSWNNPNDARFDTVRIIRSNKFFPRDPFDGTPIYSGNDTSFYDRAVTPGQTYYYSIFAKGNDGSYSSGAIAETYVPLPGEAYENAIIDPFANLPESKIVDPMIAVLTLADLEFIQNGKILANDGHYPVSVDGMQDLTVRLSYSKVPEVLKTIAVTLVNPTDSSQIFSFLLRVNAKKTAYEATIGALRHSGLYPVSVAILDYENHGMKRMRGQLEVNAGIVTNNFNRSVDPLSIILLILLSLLTLYMCLVWERKKRK